LNNKNIKIGRDKLLNILRKNNLLVKRTKRYVKTTNSNHWYNTYDNLIKERPITEPNQVYASDITYIPTLEGFMYLFLITDMYSRKIVGYDLSESLSSEGAISAIKKALKNLKNKENLIHHSDRGIQYCCNDYVNLLNQEKIQISMTEENHVYENSLAERVNGILKSEFIGFNPINDKKYTKKLVEQSIDIYNNERLHMSLDYKTPNQVHYALN
jgi:putative transposase